MAEIIKIAEIDIDYSKAVNESVRLKDEIDKVRADLKVLELQGKQNTAEYVNQSAKLKLLNDDLRQNDKFLKDVQGTQQSEIGTIKQLEKQNAALRAEQKNLNLTTEEGIKRNEEIVDQINKNTEAVKRFSDEQKKGWMSVGQYTDALNGLPFVNTIKGFISMTKAAMAFIATPIGAVIAAVAGAVTLLVNVFKNFDPLVDKIEQSLAALSASFTWVKESVIGLITGQKEHNETMKEAVNRAIELKKAEQELDDMNWLLIESNAKSKRQIDELLLQSKDRTKSEKERMALIDEALKIEEQAYLKKKAIADKEYEIALNKIIVGRNLSNEQIQQLKEQGVQAAINLKDTKAVTDEEVAAFANAIAKRETVLNESVAIREKAINRQNALEEKAIEEENKRQAEREKEEEKLRAEREKKEEKLRAEKEKRDEKERKRLEEEAKQKEKLAQDSIRNMEIEIEMYKLRNPTILEDGKKLTRELVNEENNRLEEIYRQEVAYLEAQKLEQNEFELQRSQLKLNYEQQTQANLTALREQNEALELERIEANYQNELALAEGNIFAELDLQKQGLEKQRLQEIDAAKRTGADVNLINQKYAKAEIAIERQKQMEKFSMVSGFAKDVATIFGESTKAGKLAAAASTTIDAIAASFAAYFSMVKSSIPAPYNFIAGGVAAAGTLAQGFASVKKIMAVNTESPSTPSTPSGVSFSSPISGISPTTRDTEQDMSISASILNRGGQTKYEEVRTVVVIDEVTAAQNTQNQIKTASQI